MKNKIKARNFSHLKGLIINEIKVHGNQCDLNHIDISGIRNMDMLFQSSEFNGDISQWDVSNVTSMSAMFQNSKFNGDISKWDVSKVNNMGYMFSGAEFNGDISNWNTYDLAYSFSMFSNYDHEIPYWGQYDDMEERRKAIDKYRLKDKLDKDLSKANSQPKKLKL